MHNLEGILFEEVVDAKGVTYAAYRKKLKPSFTTTWLHIAGGWISIILLCLLSWYAENRFTHWFWISIPFFSILTGFSIAYLSLFIHEAGHFYLHRDKKTNDLLANIFLCAWMGTEIKVYRKLHWQHHLQLASPTDTENSYFNPLTFIFIAETLTGIHLLRIITSKNNKKLLGEKLTKKAFYMSLTGALINLMLLVFALYHGHWQFAVTWIAALFIFFPFFASIRQLIEHRDELALNEKAFYTTTRNKVSRLFTGSLLSRLLGPAGFNKHMIHHWDPFLPFTSLKHAEKFLLQCDRTRDIIESSRTTYFAVFKKLLFTR